MNELDRKFLETRFLNIEARINGVEVEFINYTETNPVSNPQWTEERLRAIEDKIKAFSAPYFIKAEDTMFNPKTFKTEPYPSEAVMAKTRQLIFDDRLEALNQFMGKMCIRLDKLEEWFNQAKQAHENDIARVAKDFERVFIRLEALEKRQHPEVYNDK